MTEKGIFQDGEREQNTSTFKAHEQAAAILSLPSEERTHAWSEFQERFIRQREAIAQLCVRLEDRINEEPDILPEELLVSDDCNQFWSELNNEQQQLVSDKLQRYSESHQQLETVWRNYQEQYGESWQQALFADLFGSTPRGSITFQKTPLALICHVEDPGDLKTISQPADIDLLPGQGVTITRKLHPELDALTVVTSSPQTVKGKLFHSLLSEELTVHENRHAIDFGLFPGTNIESEMREMKEEINQINSESTDKEIKDLLKDRLSGLFGEVLLRLPKAELLAFYEPVEMLFDRWDASNKLGITLPKKWVESQKKSLPPIIARTMYKSSHIDAAHDVFARAGSVALSHLSGHLEWATGRDCEQIISSVVTELVGQSQRKLHTALEAACNIAQKSNLAPRELMWLLQTSEPEEWKRLSRFYESSHDTEP